MQVIQILSMNQKVQHIVALATHLQASLDPIQSCRLKEFRGFERSE
jgi:hypothetical protein